jgi:hypothetical protein
MSRVGKMLIIDKYSLLPRQSSLGLSSFAKYNFIQATKRGGKSMQKMTPFMSLQTTVIGLILVLKGGLNTIPIIHFGTIDLDDQNNSNYLCKSMHKMLLSVEHLAIIGSSFF